jgi:hypothetical protein
MPDHLDDLPSSVAMKLSRVTRCPFRRTAGDTVRVGLDTVLTMSQPTPSFLRDVIDIPERTSTSDFVLKLTDGVTDAEATLRDYVITDRLVANFDEALGLIASAMNGGTSKAAYLHGSFGSGKSHFMAVLHALLHEEPAARRRDEFAGLLAKYESTLSGRRFLLVPFHLMGAKSLEQKVLGGYVEHVRRLHPNEPIPAVHRTAALLEQSAHLRQQIGDDKFIEGLPGGGDQDDEWSERFWTTERLDEAFAGGFDDELRRRLVSELLVSWQRGFFTNALEDAEGFVSLDRGLSEIARHAKGLGYDGLMLFLDELILWLANSIGDQQFVAREVQKITNFVEGSDAHRAIPVVSFIARQRDLRDLVGEEVTGASELSFQDTLNLAVGRFDVINLEDRNLPEIARQRLLKPVSPEAEAEIDKAFEKTTHVRREVWDTLLGSDTGSGADQDSFRKSYPFSPAFISTLVHVSSALQRSRTGLKLMRQLLVDRRGDLRLGQLIPLGDLYDVISRGGDQPFTEKLKAEFETAQRLYEAKLRPYLLGVYGLSEDDLDRARLGGQVPAELAGRVRAFTGDDRLMKTLLLAALAPSVPALRNLTARRLSALNHGSITSVIPGDEVGRVARKLADWAGQFGEIRIVDGDDPGVTLELVGVDVDSVLATARGYDDVGARKLMVKRLLWQELGITATDQYLDRFDWVWRGSKRSLEVVYGNVRDPGDIRDDAFIPLEEDAWRLMVDYPFDDGNHGPADDRGRVIALGAHQQSQTVCWIPASLTAERINDLRRLVILDTVLSGQRFDQHAAHLNKDDRVRAHATLSNQREALTSKLRGVLRQAYGLATKQPVDVLTSYDEHLLSLRPGLRPTLPMGARMDDALRSIADQLLKHQYPGHPDLALPPDRKDEAVRASDARTVLDIVREAAESPDGRIEVPRKDRATMRRIANPLQLGQMGEAAFAVGRHWVEHFHRQAAQEGIDPAADLKVKDLFRWLDEPPPGLGLDRLIAQLVVAAFAEQTDRTWYRHGGLMTVQPDLTDIGPDLALRAELLPSEADWETARGRAADLFGMPSTALLRGRLVSAFVRNVSAKALRYRDEARTLVDRLEAHAKRLGIDPDAVQGRLQTARLSADLLDGLGTRQDTVEVVTRLARADLGGPAARAGKSIRSAGDIGRALGGFGWETLDLVAELPDPWQAEASSILAVLSRAAVEDEATANLIPALTRARAEATELLRRATKRPETPKTTTLPRDGDTSPESTPQTGSPVGQDTVSVTGGEDSAGWAKLRQVLAANPGKTIEITWRVVQ